MHICFFTTAHPWDDVRVKSKFVDSFLDDGATVSWVGPNRAFFLTKEQLDPRVYYHLLDAAVGWRSRMGLYRGLRETLKSIAKVDWVYCPDPDAALIAQSTGHRVLFDIHEEYHKGHTVSSLPRPLDTVGSKAVQGVLSVAARRSSVTTAVNQAILDAYHAPRERRLITYNTPPGWFSRTLSPGERPRDSHLRLFHGKALNNNGTDVVLRALKVLETRGVTASATMFPAPHDGTDYDDKFREQVEGLGVEEALNLEPAVPHKEMPDVMQRSDVGLIAYGRRLGEGSLPNRFFEYMALGLPTIVPTYAKQMCDISLPARLGLAADFENPQSVADAIEALAAQPDEMIEMAHRSQREFHNKYAWRPLFRELRTAMENVE